ncbi:MAG: hypothetical protein WC831_03235 [Parcubacteria group bacterium]|jgi:hypothetical protein
MSNRIKKAFENAVWWSGVVTVGLILGISLQFVRAWTEPTDVPPNGNVGAPLNTSAVSQIKNGILGVLGISTSYINVPGLTPVAGNVLIAQNASGQVAWAAGGGCYVSYSGGCLSGFVNKGSAGKWGRCGGSDNYASYYDRAAYFNPPGGACPSAWGFKNLGEAYVCCQQ